MKRKLLCLFDVGHTTIPLSPFFLYDTPMRRTHAPFSLRFSFSSFSVLSFERHKSRKRLTVLPYASPTLHLGALYSVFSVVCVQVLLLCVLFTRCGLSFLVFFVETKKANEQERWDSLQGSFMQGERASVWSKHSESLCFLLFFSFI